MCDVAAVNAPSQVVVSGPEAAVAAVLAEFEERGVRTRRLRVSHAFHSSLMEPMLAEFAEVARTVSYAEPAIEVVSGVTGRLAGPGELTDPGVLGAAGPRGGAVRRRGRVVAR